MSPIHAAAVMLFTLLAFGCDLRTRRIPNILNAVGTLTGLTFHALQNGSDGFQYSVFGFATGFGILFLLWIMGGGGGGDVKLMGAVGAWLGPTLTLIVFILSGVLTGLGQIGLTLTDNRIHKSGGTGPSTCGAPSRKLPYAVPVAVATWIICGLKLANS